MPTTYMSLSLPTVSVTVGPDWASALNTALTTVDAHDHSSGKGTKVPTSGININAALSFGNYAATAVGHVAFTAGTAPSATKSVYVNTTNGDLYYKDGAGNNVRLTSSGSLAIGALTITADVDFATYSPYNAGRLGLVNQGVALANSNSVFVVGGELYFRDASSNLVQLTSGGYVTPEITGDYHGGTADVHYTLAATEYHFTTNGTTDASLRFKDANISGQVILGANIVAVTTTPYALSATAGGLVLLVNCGSAKTITLHAASASKRMIWIHDSTGQAYTNNITITPNGADTIDGLNGNMVIAANRGGVLLVSDGVSAWHSL